MVGWRGFLRFWSKDVGESFAHWRQRDSLFSLIAAVVAALTALGLGAENLIAVVAIAAATYFVVLVVVITPARLWHAAQPAGTAVEAAPRLTYAELRQAFDGEQGLLAQGRRLVREARRNLDRDSTLLRAHDWAFTVSDTLGRYSDSWRMRFGSATEVFKPIDPTNGDQIANAVNGRLFVLGQMFAQAES